MTTIEKAPNFGDTRYPGDGELIGPAWQLAWETLHHETEMAGNELAAIMCDQCGIQKKTAKNLLAKARQVGILAVRRRKIGGHRNAVYRLAGEGVR